MIVENHKCPQCGGDLQPVRYPGGYLNRDQWESIRAGDWLCELCPDNNRGKSGHCYWWDEEVNVMSAAQEAFKKIIDNNLAMAMNTKSCYSFCAHLLHPKADLRYGPATKALVWAHVGAAIDRPSEQVAYFVPNNRQEELRQALDRSVACEFKDIPGRFDILDDCLIYYKV